MLSSTGLLNLLNGMRKLKPSEKLELSMLDKLGDQRRCALTLYFLATVIEHASLIIKPKVVVEPVLMIVKIFVFIYNAKVCGGGQYRKEKYKL